MTLPKVQNKISITLLIAFFIFITFLLLKGAPGNFFNYQEVRRVSSSEVVKERFLISPFEASRVRSIYFTATSIINKGTFFISKQEADTASTDSGVYKGKYLSWAPPGTALSIIPLLFFGSFLNIGQFLSFSTIALFAACSLYLIYKISTDLLKQSKEEAIFSSFIFGFATLCLPYSTTIFQHNIGVCLLLFTIFSLSKKDFLKYLSCLLVGLSPLIDYPLLVICSPVFIAIQFVFFRNINYKKNIISILCFLTGISFVCFNNYLLFENPFQATNTIIQHKKFSESYLRQHEDNILEYKNDIKNIFLIEGLPEGMYKLLLDKSKGLLYFSPVLLFSIISVLKSRKKITWLLISIVIINILLYSTFGDPWGGWSFGPRYLLPAMAILAMFTAGSFIKIRNNLFLTILFCITLLLSILNNVAGALTTILIPKNIDTTYFMIKNYEYVLQGKTASMFINNVIKTNSVTTFFWVVILLIILLGTQIMISLHRKHALQ